MRTDDLDYELPSELIAQVPAQRRKTSRLLVMDNTVKNNSEAALSSASLYL